MNAAVKNLEQIEFRWASETGANALLVKTHRAR